MQWTQGNWHLVVCRLSDILVVMQELSWEQLQPGLCVKVTSLTRPILLKHHHGLHHACLRVCPQTIKLSLFVIDGTAVSIALKKKNPR